MIGLCTDSSAQLAPALQTRHGIEVVPFTIVIDDLEHLDDARFADEYYRILAARGRVDTTAVPPSPGQFAVAYDDLIARGCTEIVSVHHGAALNAALLAAHATSATVRLVDPGICGFGLSCAAWVAGEAIVRGATLDQAVVAAERISPMVTNLFLAGATAGTDHVTLVTYLNAEPQHLGDCDTVFDAINSLARRVVASGPRLRVAIGHSDDASAAVADAVEAAVGEPANVVDVVRYRIGPSAPTQAVPGTVGCFVLPAD